MPTASNGIDAVNFRQLRESNSLHLEKQHTHIPVPPSPGLRGVAGAGVPGTPGLSGDDGMEAAPPTPAGQEVDLFGAFSSITLHYDGES